MAKSDESTAATQEPTLELLVERPKRIEEGIIVQLTKPGEHNSSGFLLRFILPSGQNPLLYDAVTQTYFGEKTRQVCFEFSDKPIDKSKGLYVENTQLPFSQVAVLHESGRCGLQPAYLGAYCRRDTTIIADENHRVCYYNGKLNQNLVTRVLGLLIENNMTPPDYDGPVPFRFSISYRTELPNLIWDYINRNLSRLNFGNRRPETPTIQPEVPKEPVPTP